MKYGHTKDIKECVLTENRHRKTEPTCDQLKPKSEAPGENF